MKPLYLLFPPSPPCLVPQSSLFSQSHREMAMMGPARGNFSQWFRNFCFRWCSLVSITAWALQRPSSLSERNGLSGGLPRVRRKRRNSNIDLFGTRGSTDWGNRERAIINLFGSATCWGQRPSQCMAKKEDEVDMGRVVSSSHHRTIKLEVKDEIGGLRTPRSSANGRLGVYLLKGCLLLSDMLTAAAALCWSCLIPEAWIADRLVFPLQPHHSAFSSAITQRTTSSASPMGPLGSGGVELTC